MSEFQGSRHEEPDTTAIRAMLADGGTFIADEAAWALCDALDAARDERDGWEIAAGNWRETWLLEAARAEAAERSVARWVDIAERAEARAEAAEGLAHEYNGEAIMLRGKLARAEDRIAKALAIHSSARHPDPYMDETLICDKCGSGIGPCSTRRALTEGTGQ